MKQLCDFGLPIEVGLLIRPRAVNFKKDVVSLLIGITLLDIDVVRFPISFPSSIDVRAGATRSSVQYYSILMCKELATIN